MALATDPGGGTLGDTTADEPDDEQTQYDQPVNTGPTPGSPPGSSPSSGSNDSGSGPDLSQYRTVVVIDAATMARKTVDVPASKREAVAAADQNGDGEFRLQAARSLGITDWSGGGGGGSTSGGSESSGDRMDSTRSDRQRDPVLGDAVAGGTSDPLAGLLDGSTAALAVAAVGVAGAVAWGVR